MTPDVSVKSLRTLEEMKDMQSLERTVWGMDPIPIHQTFTAVKNGGLVLGAYVDGQIAGFSYGFPGFRNNTAYLCSHMLGVSPQYQGLGLGSILKEKQRELAIEKGYSLITWTFDPLLSLNAYLNLHKLRGVVAEYSENLYGQMADQLNRGFPSDRFTVHWWIDSEYVAGNHRWFDDLSVKDKENSLLLKVAADEVKVQLERKLGTEDLWFVPLPADFQQLKSVDPNLALEWRMKTRAVFQALFAKGFVGVDIKKDSHKDCYHYVFVKKDKLTI